MPWLYNIRANYACFKCITKSMLMFLFVHLLKMSELLAYDHTCGYSTDYKLL